MLSYAFPHFIRKTFNAIDTLHREAAAGLSTRPPRPPEHAANMFVMGIGAALTAFYLNAGGIQAEFSRIWVDPHLSLTDKIENAWQFLVPRLADSIAPGIPLGHAILALLGIAFALDVVQHVASSLWRYASGQALRHPGGVTGEEQG